MQSWGSVCILNLPAQVVALSMLFSKLHAPNACLQPLLEFSSHCICSLSHLITARLNSTGLGNLSADLTAGSCGSKNFTGCLMAPAPPSLIAGSRGGWSTAAPLLPFLRRVKKEIGTTTLQSGTALLAEMVRSPSSERRG